MWTHQLTDVARTFIACHCSGNQPRGADFKILPPDIFIEEKLLAFSNFFLYSSIVEKVNKFKTIT